MRLIARPPRIAAIKHAAVDAKPFVDLTCDIVSPVAPVESLTRVTVNGKALPLQPTGTMGEYVSGVRYRAWNPPSALHPTIAVHAPLTFDIVDTWMNRSLGGCQYHVPAFRARRSEGQQRPHRYRG